MSKKANKRYDSKLKSKIVLETIKNEQTLAEIGSKYQVHPRMIQYWKKQFLDNIEAVFEKENLAKIYKDQLKSKVIEINELYRQNGKLNSQLEWAKKKVEVLELE